MNGSEPLAGLDLGIEKPSQRLGFWNGEGRIRTDGELASTLVFKTKGKASQSLSFAP